MEEKGIPAAYWFQRTFDLYTKDFDIQDIGQECEHSVLNSRGTVRLSQVGPFLSEQRWSC